MVNRAWTQLSKSLQVVTGAVGTSSQSKRLPKLRKEELASWKEGISVSSKKIGTQFGGDWNSLSHIRVFAMSTKPLFRLGTLLCLEEREKDFCLCV